MTLEVAADALTCYLSIHAADYITESSEGVEEINIEAQLALQRRKVDTTWPKRAGERI